MMPGLDGVPGGMGALGAGPMPPAALAATLERVRDSSTVSSPRTPAGIPRRRIGLSLPAMGCPLVPGSADATPPWRHPSGADGEQGWASPVGLSSGGGEGCGAGSGQSRGVHRVARSQEADRGYGEEPGTEEGEHGPFRRSGPAADQARRPSSAPADESRHSSLPHGHEVPVRHCDHPLPRPTRASSRRAGIVTGQPHPVDAGELTPAPLQGAAWTILVASALKPALEERHPGEVDLNEVSNERWAAWWSHASSTRAGPAPGS